MVTEREVAGMRCGEVLAELSEFLDGELSDGRQAQITEHLQGCDVCERFGGAFTSAVQALREGESSHPSEGSAIFDRLATRLAQAQKGRDSC